MLYHIKSHCTEVYDTISYDTIWYHMIWHHITWYDMIWYHIIWYRIESFCTVLYDTISYDIIRYDTIFYYMIWYDIIWYDMVWCIISDYHPINTHSSTCLCTIDGCEYRSMPSTELRPRTGSHRGLFARCSSRRKNTNSLFTSCGFRPKLPFCARESTRGAWRVGDFQWFEIVGKLIIFWFVICFPGIYF